MSYTVTTQGSVSLTQDTFRNAFTLGATYTPSISASAWVTQTVVTGSWVPLTFPTSSLTTGMRAAVFTNDNLAGTFTIATGSAGQNVLAYLQAQDDYVLPWSGSTPPPLYVMASNNPLGTMVLQYTLVPN